MRSQEDKMKMMLIMDHRENIQYVLDGSCDILRRITALFVTANHPIYAGHNYVFIG